MIYSKILCNSIKASLSLPLETIFLRNPTLMI
jgi:hypothetical protein